MAGVLAWLEGELDRAVRRRPAGRELADHALPRHGVGRDRVDVERLARGIGLALDDLPG
jgi:hypothetical protein